MTDLASLHAVLAGLRPGLLLRLSAGAIGGGAAGTLHFATLYRNAALFAQGRAASALGLQCARIAGSSAVLFAIAQAGPGPLLAGAAGFLLVRQASLLAARHGGVAS